MNINSIEQWTRDPPLIFGDPCRRAGVSWGEAGVGVVATQSFLNKSFGLRGLELLKQGKSPQVALDQLLSDDPGKEFRQVAILDMQGRVATHTGKNCVESAGH